MSETESTLSFRDLELPEALLNAVLAVGYESPSPIQAQTIPSLLAGRDVLGQAQTGTGKTAAFALPMLARLDLKARATQAMVLAPTRELAIQVAEAFQKYAVNLPGFHVLPIYGGQSYGPQLSALKRGVHVVVGTPGRVMDHLKRGTLDLSQVRMVALDEADEMLNMGFLEDVEWILKHLPEQRQVALFSATMPSQIKRIAQTYLRDPAEVLIRSKTTTAANIRQRYWMVSGLHKIDALTRVLEVENFDAMIIFSRTKLMTEELATKLEARGYAAAALNGDIPQQQRERTVQRLRDGQLDIIIATDVAARGLNVERISHVLNFDIPLDIESYVHRIGRTGRAGRSGEAILFVAPREKRMLMAIERATRQPIEHMTMPTPEDVNNQRIVRFKQRITDTLEAGELDIFRDVVAQFETEQNIPAIEVAAALARMAHEAQHGKTPLLLRTDGRERPSRFDQAKPRRESGFSFDPLAQQAAQKTERPAPVKVSAKPVKPVVASDTESVASDDADHAQADVAEIDLSGDVSLPAPRHSASADDAPMVVDDFDGDGDADAAPAAPARFKRDDKPRREEAVRMETYRVAVGHEHQVKPGNLVGAIANEAGLDSKYIGRIEIHDSYSLVDLPEGMPKEILQHLKKVWVAGQELRIALQRPRGEGGEFEARDDKPRKPRRFDGDERPSRREYSADDRPRRDRLGVGRPNSDRPDGDRPRFVKPRHDRGGVERPARDAEGRPERRSFRDAGSESRFVPPRDRGGRDEGRREVAPRGDAPRFASRDDRAPRARFGDTPGASRPAGKFADKRGGKFPVKRPGPKR